MGLCLDANFNQKCFQSQSQELPGRCLEAIWGMFDGLDCLGKNLESKWRPPWLGFSADHDVHVLDLLRSYLNVFFESVLERTLGDSKGSRVSTC